MKNKKNVLKILLFYLIVFNVKVNKSLELFKNVLFINAIPQDYLIFLVILTNVCLIVYQRMVFIILLLIYSLYRIFKLIYLHN